MKSKFDKINETVKELDNELMHIAIVVFVIITIIVIVGTIIFISLLDFGAILV